MEVGQGPDPSRLGLLVPNPPAPSKPLNLVIGMGIFNHITFRYAVISVTWCHTPSHNHVPFLTRTLPQPTSFFSRDAYDGRAPSILQLLLLPPRYRRFIHQCLPALAPEVEWGGI